MNCRHLPLWKMALAQPSPCPPWAQAPLAIGSACGWRGDANCNTSLDSRSTLAPSSWGGCPGWGAGITSASAEAVGKGQGVWIVVSGSVSRSGAQETWGRAGTERGPCWNEASLFFPAQLWVGHQGSCTPFIVLSEPQEYDSHHLESPLQQHPGDNISSSLGRSEHWPRN